VIRRNDNGSVSQQTHAVRTITWHALVRDILAPKTELIMLPFELGEHLAQQAVNHLQGLDRFIAHVAVPVFRAILQRPLVNKLRRVLVCYVPSRPCGRRTRSLK
jgi:hypothetical protein